MKNTGLWITIIRYDVYIYIYVHNMQGITEYYPVDIFVIEKGS